MVVIIIGILIAIMIPIMFRQIKKAQAAVDLSNARQIRSALSYELIDGNLEIREGSGIAVFVDKDQLTVFSYDEETYTTTPKLKGILLNGKTADSGKIIAMLEESGFTNDSCKQKDITWYAVTISDDGMSMYWEGKGRKNLKNGKQVGWQLK